MSTYDGTQSTGNEGSAGKSHQIQVLKVNLSSSKGRSTGAVFWIDSLFVKAKSRQWGKTAALRYGKGEPIEVCHGSWDTMLHSESCVLEIWPGSNAKEASQVVP